MDLTRDYENAAFIPGADDYPPRWAEEAADWRAAMAAVGQFRALDVGGHPVELFLPSARPAGLVVFVHGGYWRRFSAADFSWLARGPMARDLAVALPAYPLCPSVRIRDITRHVARAVEATLAAVPEGPVTVTGHSAGGHLAARMACPGVLPGTAAARIVRCVPISPVSELEPLIRTDMNDDLRLDAEEAAAESPARLRPLPHVSAEVWVGADERPAFLDQARWLAEAWGCGHRIVRGRHHFDVIDGLADAADGLCLAVDPRSGPGRSVR